MGKYKINPQKNLIFNTIYNKINYFENEIAYFENEIAYFEQYFIILNNGWIKYQNKFEFSRYIYNILQKINLLKAKIYDTTRERDFLYKKNYDFDTSSQVIRYNWLHF